MLTLWDLIEPLVPKRMRDAHAERARQNGHAAKPAIQRRPPPLPTPSVAVPPKRLKIEATKTTANMQDRYDAVTKAMLDKYQIRVRKWRSGMTGIAWYVTYRDGTISRLIEAPKPKGPMSAAVFLHEIGHHAIGFNTYRPRCLEEFHAWRWSLEQMEAHGLNITDGVRHRMHLSLWYAVDKAKRRGIREIPPELIPFLERPPRSARRKSRA